MMANLREPYASVSLASLAWSDTQEKAIDRVAASGRCSRLGVLLWKSKYLVEPDALRSATVELVRAYRARYKFDSNLISEAFVGQALVEYIAPQCRACMGRGELMMDDRLRICAACLGSKLHCYTDTERAQCMQLSYGITKASAYKIRWLLDYIEGEDRAMNDIMNVQLER